MAAGRRGRNEQRRLGPFNLTVVTMRQRQVPAALLGRVTSLYGTAWARL